MKSVSSFLLWMGIVWLSGCKSTKPSSAVSFGPPVGLPPAASLVSEENSRLSTLAIFTGGLYIGETRAQVMDRIGKLAPRMIEVPFDRRVMNVQGGRNSRSILTPGQFAGSQGAGPCIGVILVIPRGDSFEAHVYHFTATDDPRTTLSKRGQLPPGARAAVFGGEGHERQSNRTLESVMSYLDPLARGGRLDLVGYSDSSGLWVDDRGEFFLTHLDLPLP